MIGNVLDFDPDAGGVLRGEDGKRYTFSAGDWRGKSPPSAGMRVDFDEAGEAARNLYPLPDQGARGAPGSWLAGRPGIPIGLLILIACFLPFLTLGPFSANLFNVVGVASSLGDYAPANLNMETGLWLFHGLYVVPALALILLYLEWQGLAGRWTRIGIGLIGLVGPVAIALGARALFTAAAPRHQSLGARVLRELRHYVAPEAFTPSIGIGWIAVAILSIALILIGIFWRRPGKA